MPQFAYKARRRSGEVVQDVLEAPDRGAALNQIERLGLFPVMVDGVKGNGPVVGTPPARGAASTEKGGEAIPGVVKRIFRRKRKPKLQELATFTQQLTNLLKCGMPLVTALNSMGHLETKGIPKEVAQRLKQDVMEGRSLSDSMAKQPFIFADLYVNMVRAGEQSGALVEVLQRLSKHYERFAEVQQKFMAALIYPAIVGCVGVVIIIFFMTFMLPKFLTIFEGLKVPLPLATRILVNISHFFGNLLYMSIAGMVVIAIGIVYMRFKASPEGRRKIDEWKMGLPIVGKAVRLNIFGQFARTLGTLLSNGVPVLTALKISEEIMSNVVVKEAIAKTREEVTDGKTIAQPLARSKLFPQLMIDLLKIGEETGDVPSALNNIAETYENELGIHLRVMTNLIEPAMIIVMAIGVGGLLFSVLSAMFAITSSINR
jgi:type IV pilus assembly protein PilC